MALIDKVLMPEVERLFACLNGQLDLLAAADRPARRAIMPGESVSFDVALTEDVCCEGFAWVRPAGFVGSSTFPGPREDVDPCPPPLWALRMEMGVVRCAPVGTAATLPTPTNWLETTRRTMNDAVAMRRAVWCCYTNAALGAPPGLLVDLHEYNPVGPEGMCVGGTMEVTVRVLNCDECAESYVEVDP